MARIHVPIWLRTLVLERANWRCEYCLIHQDDSPDTHQMDHIIAIRHGGRTISGNLACACAPCNHFKGTDFATIDPASGVVIMLFNPRTQLWSEHFVLEGARIAGLTPTGQATIELLRLNDDARLLEREVLIAENRYPR
jgi:hypothetical protein